MKKFLSDQELQATPTGNFFVFDIECYINYCCVAFKCIASGKYVYFERSATSEINIEKLNFMLWHFTLISFNGLKYDVPMLQFIIQGWSNADLKGMSNKIIQEKLTPWNIEKQFKIKIPDYNHIDLIEVAPLMGSLKLYAGRMHVPLMQDLPYPHDKTLTQDEAANVGLYCLNDLDNTQFLYEELLEQIQLRVDMSAQYGTDLRSKSDAQIAETVVKHELEKLTGIRIYKPAIDWNARLKYNMPACVEFQTPTLKKLLELINKIEFTIGGDGKPKAPPEFEGLSIDVGKMVYKVGMGGLHSQESSIAHYATENIILADNDVESFYPRIMLNQGLYPAHLGNAFLTIFDYLVNKRLQAKKEGNKVIADSLKIVINGLFGKLASIYSCLFAPQLLLQVTITGQLVLLMLIEALELNGIEVISGNTDGVVSKYNKTEHEKVRSIIKAWENHTNFKMEETRYSGLYCRDVNNYIAIKPNGDVKRKGAYSEKGSALNSRLSKNPEHLVCSESVINLIKTGESIETYIKNCKDIAKFVCVRKVEGGAKKGNQYLGKVIRWYYAKGELSNIEYASNGNKVPKSDNAKPLMNLPPECPQDINYSWYVNEANSILHEIGYIRKIKSLSLF